MCVILHYCIYNLLVRVRILFLFLRRHFHALVRQILFYKTKNTRGTASILRCSPGVKIFYLDYDLDTFHLL